jgi:hypothetical protein
VRMGYTNKHVRIFVLLRLLPLKREELSGIFSLFEDTSFKAFVNGVIPLNENEWHITLGR